MSALTGYLAAEGFEEQLRAELGGVEDEYGRLMLVPGPPQPAHWAQNVWHDVLRLEAPSIHKAAQQLKNMQRNWWPYSFQLHRRTALIAAALPHVAARELLFPEAPPAAPLGSFTLIDERTLLCAARCSSQFPNGEPRFREYKEHEGPPSRAYLKLFEALTLLGERPGPGQRCLELGASPGGWTWVLASLGADVLAVDRAPLAANIARMPRVKSMEASAFGLTPATVGSVDWLFCDVICYPERLYTYVRRWLDSGACERFVCTLKFQGKEHYRVIDDFAAVPGARVVHLFHNRHELCWLRVPPKS